MKGRNIVKTRKYKSFSTYFPHYKIITITKYLNLYIKILNRITAHDSLSIVLQ